MKTMLPRRSETGTVESLHGLEVPDPAALIRLLGELPDRA